MKARIAADGHHSIELLPAQEKTVTQSKVLIDHRASMEARDNEGNTPLHQAARETRDVYNIACLIDHGVSVNAINNDGLAPIDYVVKLAHVPDNVLKYLLTKGATPRAEQTKTQLDWRKGPNWRELIRQSELMAAEPGMPEHLARYVMTFQEETGGQRPPSHVR